MLGTIVGMNYVISCDSSYIKRLHLVCSVFGSLIVRLELHVYDLKEVYLWMMFHKNLFARVCIITAI